MTENQNNGSASASANSTDQQLQQEFAIQRIYIKDMSFEAPKTPQIFREEWQPLVSLDLGTKTAVLEKDIHEVVLSLTATVKLGEQTAFLAEVHQAGIFTIKSFPDDQMRQLLGSYCLNILFPYAREAVSDLVVRGGFPPLYLAPVNFDALLQQHMENQKQQAATASEDERKH